MKLIGRCLDLLYPPRCVFCDALLGGGGDIFLPQLRGKDPHG